MPRKKRDPNVMKRTMICDCCGRKSKSRRYIIKHLKKCTGFNETTPSIDFMCTICNITFENSIMLEAHKSEVHTQQSIPVKMNPYRRKCNGCQKMCGNTTKLWLHIRKNHYNLLSKVPYCEQKKVNQVWFEKVLNCNNVMEIKKTAPNRLVMRKLDDNTAIKVVENNTETIDLRHLYPTNRMKQR